MVPRCGRCAAVPLSYYSRRGNCFSGRERRDNVLCSVRQRLEDIRAPSAQTQLTSPNESTPCRSPVRHMTRQCPPSPTVHRGCPVSFGRAIHWKTSFNIADAMAVEGPGRGRGRGSLPPPRGGTGKSPGGRLQKAAAAGREAAW